MQQPKTKQRITYFAVNPDVYQRVVSLLATLPYNQVAGVLTDFAEGSRAMFDELPPIPKFDGPGGRVVPDAPAGGNGKDNDPPAGAKPGWRKLGPSEERGPAAEYDANSDAWWVRADDAGQNETGGAES